MNNRYTFFTDASNTTRYRFANSIEAFNTLLDMINQGLCGLNPSLSENSTTSSYINRVNWGDGQVMLDRGANDTANNTLEICVDGQISKTGETYFNDMKNSRYNTGMWEGIVYTSLAFMALCTILTAALRIFFVCNDRKSAANIEQGDGEEAAPSRCCK